MLVEVFAAFSRSIEVHSNFFKDFYLFGGQILEFRLHFYLGSLRICAEANTPKTERFGQFASFGAR